MKQPLNFETLAYEHYKFLGINWEIRVEGLTIWVTEILVEFGW